MALLIYFPVGCDYLMEEPPICFPNTYRLQASVSAFLDDG